MHTLIDAAKTVDRDPEGELKPIAVPKSERIVPRCSAPWQSLMIEGNGVVQPCAYRGNYGNPVMHPPLGNVNKQTIAEIWNGEEMQKLRGWMAAGDLDAAGCGKCLAVAQNQPLQLSYDLDVDVPDSLPGVYKENLNLKREEMARGATVIESKPLVLYITPTHRCNLRCTHCYETPTRGETIRRIGFQEEVEELLPTLSELVPGGGEPMVLSFWRKIFRVSNEMVNPYLKLAFTTGGFHVEQEALDAMSRFADSQVMVSFDAPNKTTFDSIRVNADFDQVVENIQRFQKMTGRRREGATVMHISVMKQNIRLLPELLRLAATLEIPFNFQPVVAYPVDHSLRCFEYGPLETIGWQDVLDRAPAIITDFLMPVLRMSAKRRGRTIADNVEKSLLDHISALGQLVPWDMLKQDHYQVDGSIPEHQMGYMQLLKRYALKDQNKGQQMLVAFFPITDNPYPECHHFAKLRADGSFRAVLPAGKYSVVILRRENAPANYNGFEFEVEADPKARIVNPLTEGEDAVIAPEPVAARETV